jgi:hypothetical protein
MKKEVEERKKNVRNEYHAIPKEAENEEGAFSRTSGDQQRKRPCFAPYVRTNAHIHVHAMLGRGGTTTDA